MNLERFEPLGSNCEFGFVLRHAGNERPSVMRWTAIEVAGLIALLDRDFADCFETATIAPHTPAMVMSQPYRWAFHSALHSADGVFTAGTRFERLFRIERSRILHEIAVFSARLRAGGLVAVHSSARASDDDAVALREAVDRFSGHGGNQVLVVAADGGVPGSLRPIAERCQRGTVGWLAPFDQADHADFASWDAVLAGMAERGAC